MLDHFTPQIARRADLWELVAGTLRWAIITGELEPGIHLQEPLLAQKFGVSRVPVREALARLEHEGLVRSEPRRGAFVVGFTASDVQEIYEMRQFIETRAGRLAAERVTSDDLARLQRFIDQMSDAVRNKQVSRVAEPDIAFHSEIVAISGHRRLLAAWEPIAGIVSTLLKITNTSHPDMAGAIASHQVIANALADHDPVATEAAIQRHLTNGERTMQEALRNGMPDQAAASMTS